jgi:predicted MFS family arabinose efflux permease
LSETDPASSRGYRNYVLGVLLVAYIFNFVDRQLPSILASMLMDEFGLSGTQIGLMTGPAFALFYTFVGIPIARWADVGSRRTIIALALAVWSAMTAVTSFALSFLHLALARIGVGIGEAGCSPPAHSLISDLFPPEKRATALSIYSLGIPIGGALGTLVGGWLGQLYGWRVAFLVVGLPGIALALLVRFTIREPARGPSHVGGESVKVVARFMLRLPSFLHLSAGTALHAFYGYGAAAFIPIFLIRVHGLELGEVSTALAALALTTGTAGTYLGGWLSDRLAHSDARWYMWVPAIGSLVAIPFTFLFYLWPEPWTALLLSIPGTIVGGLYLGPCFAMTQSLAKPHMRAMASAVLLFLVNLIGLGAGPVAVGAIWDALTPFFGIDGLRYSLLGTVAIGAAWSAVHFHLAAQTLREDLLAKDLA